MVDARADQGAQGRRRERAAEFYYRDDALREALCAHVRAALRSSRVPREVAFRDTLPYNETGKVLRREVRAWLAKSAT